jgi:arylsulfatase A-like enzyme
MTTTTATENQNTAKGLKTGVVNELHSIWNVKPGHAQPLREAIGRYKAAATARAKDFVFLTVHSAHFALFDNDRRFLFILTFETEWYPYIEDATKIAGGAHWDVFQHLEGGAEVPKDQWTADLSRSILQAHRVQLEAFLLTIPDVTVAEELKAQRLMKAFQQVLDNPKAAKALQDPALKPLLDEAAA